MNSKRCEIVSPVADSLLVGGASIFFLACLALISLFGSSELVVQNFLVLTVIFNGTHFLASYRLLYGSIESVLAYPWASIYLPILLLVYSAVALGLNIFNSEITLPVVLLTGAAAVYLALHYTGQAWGMMASFAYLDGIRFQPGERAILRLSLRTMAVWHMLWALRSLWSPSALIRVWLDVASALMNGLGIVSFVLGAWCLCRVGRAEGRRVSLRVVLPYLALYVWYLFIFFFPAALFWVQISHALQYLPFPMRVELNRLRLVSDGHIVERSGVAYCLILLLLSALVFGVVPSVADRLGPGASSVWVIIAAVINIHHYFIDGCIWRISNPVVRKELFAHTQA